MGGISSFVPHQGWGKGGGGRGASVSVVLFHTSHSVIVCYTFLSHSCLLSDGHPRLGLGAELCKGSNELDTVQRREMAVRMERKIVGRRRKHLDTNTGKRYEVLCVRNIYDYDFSSPSVFIKIQFIQIVLLLQY